MQYILFKYKFGLNVNNIDSKFLKSFVPEKQINQIDIFDYLHRFSNPRRGWKPKIYAISKRFLKLIIRKSKL